MNYYGKNLERISSFFEIMLGYAQRKKL